MKALHQLAELTQLVKFKQIIMKKYIGTKQVEAVPMNLGEFINKSGRNPYANDGKMHGNNEEGYLVKYQDGYESWSPKDVFEGAYKIADTALDRMLIEGEDLTIKLEKLQAFTCTSKFGELDAATRAMLVAQANIMQEYQGVLNQRYTKMESGEGSLGNLSFSVAIALLKSGFAIRRTGWNGKGLFVVKQVPAHIDSEIIPKMQSLPQSAKDLIMKGKGFIDYTSQCLIYNENTGRADSWVPSISDVFAEDWEIVQ